MDSSYNSLAHPTLQHASENSLGWHIETKPSNCIKKKVKVRNIRNVYMYSTQFTVHFCCQMAPH